MKELISHSNFVRKSRCSGLLLPCIVALLLLSSVALTQQPDRGFRSANSYATSGLEAVNLANGNLVLNIPVASLPAGRGGSPGYGISLQYNSKLWESKEAIEQNGYPDENGNTKYSVTRLNLSDSGGWRLALSYNLKIIDRLAHEMPDPCWRGDPVEHLKFRWKVEMEMPDGSVKTFYPMISYGINTITAEDGWSAVDTTGKYYQVVRTTHPSTGSCMLIDSYPQLSTSGMTYITMDGSQLRLFIPYQSGNWKLFFPDGRLVENAPPDDPSVTQRMTDRNGNSVEHRPEGICDDVGRCITFSGANGVTNISTKGVGGETVTASIEWAGHWVQRKYRVTTAANAPEFLIFETARNNILSVKRIVFPAQLGTQEMLFEYHGQVVPPADGVETDEWGELKSVTLPTGARTSFYYDQELDTASAVLERWTTKKKLKYTEQYPGETPIERAATWLYHVSKLGGDVTSPDGSFSAESKHHNPNSAWWTNGLPYANSNPDNLVERVWAHNIPFSISASGPYQPGIFAGVGTSNAYVKTELTTLRNKNGGISPSSPTAIKDHKYDKNGNVTETSEYDYVTYGSITRSGGAVTGLPVLSLKRRTINTYYNQAAAADSPTANQNSYSDPSSARLKNVIKSTEIRDAAGTPVSRTEFFYDDPNNRGNLIETRLWDSTKGPYTEQLSPSNSISTFAEYDQHGNAINTTDARGVETTITFGDVIGPNGAVAGLYPTKTVAASNYPSLARTSTAVFDFYTGVTMTTTDVDNGISSITEYDALGRPTKIRAAANTPLETWTRTEYHDDDRVVVVRSDIESKGDGRKVASQFYDQLGRVCLSKTLEDALNQSATNETDGIKIETRYAYHDPTPGEPDDPGSTLGSYVLISNPFRAASSATATGESTMGWTLNYARNGALYSEVRSYAGAALPQAFGGINTSSTGIVTTEVDADGTTVMDQAGKKRRTVMNALRQLIRADEPDATGDLGTAQAPRQPTYYSYNPLGKMTRVVQGIQNRYFLYDSLGRLLRVRQPEQDVNPALNTTNNPENNNWTAGFGYDNNGNLRTSVDARNVVTTTNFDAMNRQISRSYSDSTPPVYFQYDDPAVANAKGKLTRIASNISETRYLGYDGAGRLVASDQITDGKSYPSTYKYNLAGLVVEQSYPSGRVVKRFLGTDGDISAIASRSANSAFKNYGANFDYTPSGLKRQAQLGNGLWENTEVNSRNQVAELRLGNTPTNGNIWRVNYHYGELDPNGNVDGTRNTGNLAMHTISAAGMAHPFVQRYRYDPLHRIVEAKETANGTQTWTQSFGYDRYGNRTTFAQDVGGQQLQINNLTLPQIDPVTNRFLASEGYSYDSSGNLTGDPQGRSFIFNADNKQSEVIDGDGNRVGEYFYDGNGKRVKKITQSETVVFVYDGLGNLIAELSTAPPAPSPTVNYTTTDTLGSPRIVTNSRGEIVSRRDFMPFGEELGADPMYRTANLKYGSTDGIRQKFTGYERDDETDLDFAQARMYTARLGRFTTVDPVVPDAKNPQTFNGYQYCLNNPFRYVDEKGKYEKDVHVDLTAALAYAAGFSRKQANVIARANQWVDDNPETNPEVITNVGARRKYHFTDSEGLARLWSDFETFARNGSNGESFSAIGTLLHAKQDSFSHQGFNAVTGQASSGFRNGLFTSWKSYWEEVRKVDKTDFDPEKAEAMAESTFTTLLSAVNEMSSKEEKFGRFNKAISYDVIRPQVALWVRAKTQKEKTKHLAGIYRAIDRERTRMEKAEKK